MAGPYDQLAFNEQGPGQAFQRYMAMLQGQGSFSAPIQNAMEERGRLQSHLAPLFGYGIGQDLGGRGTDFAPFFGQQQPSWGDVRGKLGEASGAVKAQGDRTAWEGRKAAHESSAGPGGMPFNEQAPAAPSLYQTAMAGNYNDPDEQLRALQAGMGSQVNPYFRSGIMSGLGNSFTRQQATNPSQSFFDYAKGQGWF